MPRLPLILAIGAAICTASCGPGGISCARLNLVGLPNRNPVMGATVFSYRESSPASRVQGIPIAIPGAYDPSGLACSGEIVIEITHRDYQMATVRYRSPRDRSYSGNSQEDQFTVELTPR